MEQDPWLVKETGRIVADLRTLLTDLNLVERKYQIDMSDKDKTIVLGPNEWKLFKERVDDACREMIENLGDFVDNDYHRQLHWSALRLLTASGVVNAELKSYRDRLAYIARHPSNTSVDVNKMFNWFAARIEPLCGRLSVRLVQIMARVMDPQSWDVSTELSDFNATTGATVTLKLRFEPNSDERVRLEREKVKRIQRMRMDEED